MIKQEYRRDLQHTYLILPGRAETDGQYQDCMLVRNRINGLLPCRIGYLNAKKQYYYDISSRQPLRYLYSVRKMRYKELAALMYEIQSVMREAEKYLLDSGKLLLTADLIYKDLETDKVLLVYYPETVNAADNVRKAGEDLLELIDYSDEGAVDTAHYFYEKSREENFCWDSIIEYLEKKNLSGQDASGRSYVKPDRPEPGLPVERERPERREYDRTDKEDGPDGETACRSVLSQKGRQRFCRRIREIQGGLPFPAEAKTIWVQQAAPAAAVVVLMAAAGCYVWKHYVLTMAETAAAALLCAGVLTAMIVRAGIKHKEAGEEHTALSAGEQETAGSRDEENGTEYDDGEPEPVGMEQDREADYNKEADYSGETVCLSVIEEEEERRLEGRVRGKEVIIFLDTMPFLIGKLKDRVSYSLPDASVSRLHAVFKEENGKIFLSDLQSKNGTFKNEIRLEAGEALEVRPGDELRFGKLKFTYY